MIGACRPESEEFQELQRSTLGPENQTSLSRSEPWFRLEKKLSRVEHPCPEDENGGQIFPVREIDTERK